ncbi:hypothetical protein BASA50_003969 [Batrachochytrium salamandrivorans]|uniref:Uncharacterized protein n=1 Tax=Batrachochytrium salamandrivorans TaxID=1357716 RepID=A0ABQ8FI31_9FUNG|nr:hypothetical protein BASA50_003969 [Batrachochytrium salamandrivorans]KAJ1340717.1 hypothetical protein BSLG_004811 [Batrachochytrium salamandrivorans]
MLSWLVLLLKKLFPSDASRLHLPPNRALVQSVYDKDAKVQDMPDQVVKTDVLSGVKASVSQQCRCDACTGRMSHDASGDEWARASGRIVSTAAIEADFLPYLADHLHASRDRQPLPMPPGWTLEMLQAMPRRYSTLSDLDPEVTSMQLCAQSRAW